MSGGRRLAPVWGLVLGVLLASLAPARAENVGITGRKLVVIDKLEFSNKAAVRFFSLDSRIDKGDGLLAANIGATFDITIEALNHPPIAGAFSIPTGFSETAGWRVNRPTLAKFVNPGAPGGPTQVRVASVGTNHFVKISAKGLGDLPLPIESLRFINSFAVQVRFTVMNGTETIMHCTLFDDEDCVFSLIAGGTGHKLQCTNGDAIPDCAFPTPF
ncbi:MAG TPA: hypothetical protein VNO26_03550 [Candidatus Limnocylindria bacterium]|nr:hypothetical protein [Candidatus Limnocylindria bacterium]